MRGEKGSRNQKMERFELNFFKTEMRVWLFSEVKNGGGLKKALVEASRSKDAAEQRRLDWAFLDASMVGSTVFATLHGSTDMLFILIRSPPCNISSPLSARLLSPALTAALKLKPFTRKSCGLFLLDPTYVRFSQ